MVGFAIQAFHKTRFTRDKIRKCLDNPGSWHWQPDLAAVCPSFEDVDIFSGASVAGASRSHTINIGRCHFPAAMATTSSQFLASMARLSLAAPCRPSTTPIPRFLLPLGSTTSPASQSRFASGTANTMGKKREKKKKAHKSFRSYDLRNQEQYSLCDAIRYVGKGWCHAAASFDMCF